MFVRFFSLPLAEGNEGKKPPHIKLYSVWLSPKSHSNFLLICEGGAFCSKRKRKTLIENQREPSIVVSSNNGYLQEDDDINTETTKNNLENPQLLEDLSIENKNLIQALSSPTPDGLLNCQLRAQMRLTKNELNMPETEIEETFFGWQLAKLKNNEAEQSLNEDHLEQLAQIIQLPPQN